MRWIAPWLLALSIAAPAEAQVVFPTTETVGPWHRAAGFKPHRRSKALKIDVRQACFGHRVTKRRTAHSLVITVTYFDVVPIFVDGYYAVPSCPATLNPVKVKLGRRLGRRSVRDGSFDPPKRRYHSPRR